jgi:ATP:cob(I)alamin adenosyltransferase
MSGRMAGLEFSPLPAAWRSVTQMSYPYDLPSRSRVQLDYPLGWLRIRQIPIVARQAQIDTFLACQILSDTTNHMADTFVRDYLVERIERDIDHLNASLQPLNSFILPGGTPAAAYLHLARTICRRAERIMVELAAQPTEPVSDAAIQYMNRLSDFLFIASRTANGNGAGDVLWVPGQNR